MQVSLAAQCYSYYTEYNAARYVTMSIINFFNIHICEQRCATCLVSEIFAGSYCLLFFFLFFSSFNSASASID